jgi:hypothetical protein
MSISGRLIGSSSGQMDFTRALLGNARPPLEPFFTMDRPTVEVDFGPGRELGGSFRKRRGVGGHDFHAQHVRQNRHGRRNRSVAWRLDHAGQCVFYSRQNADNAMRWTFVSMTRGAGSATTEALDRVTLPQTAHDQISELMSAGASLIISDEGLGRETGKGTNFIVLTR